MSFLNKIFQSIPVKIPDRSGFDLSHEVLSTAQCGTVTPVTHFEVLPGDTISMGSLMKVTLPPFAVPFMGRIDAELTAAFIPYRLLWKGWERFITQNDGVSPSVSSGSPQIPFSVPLVDLHSVPARGTLADYLGYNYASRGSALPFLAYHKFCDDWIRDDNIMKPFFAKNPIIPSATQSMSDLLDDLVLQMPHFVPHYQAFEDEEVISLPLAATGAPTDQSFAEKNVYDYSIGLGDLRQRCWSKDYFTTATTRPQAGAEASVTFDTSGATGSFTIASLRAANALQKWAERNNIAGTEYGDQILAHFGVRPPDAVLNRSILLGQIRTPVYVGSVTNNNADANSAKAGTSSPYGNILGSAAGFGSGSDKGSLVDNFTAKEHGIIMVFFTLIPHAYYDSGILRQNRHTLVGDFAWPEFAGIGDQAIEVGELYGGSNNPTSIFGYNQRYSEYKFLPDRVSGKLATGEDLSVYALKRSFSSNPSLGSQFLEIPTNYLLQVFASWDPDAGTGDEFPVDWSCMMDLYFDAKALRVLPEYSLPHL